MGPRRQRSLGLCWREKQGQIQLADRFGKPGILRTRGRRGRQPAAPLGVLFCYMPRLAAHLNAFTFVPCELHG